MLRTVGIETCFITPRLCYKNVANLKKSAFKISLLMFLLICRLVYNCRPIFTIECLLGTLHYEGALY